MMRKSGLGPPPVSCSHRILTTPVGLESAPCFTAFVPSSCTAKPICSAAFGFNFQFGPFNENGTATQIMERSELASDKVSNVRAVPIALDEKIVNFSKRTEAPAEACIEIIEALSLSSNLVCHALHNGKKILRSVRQLMHDEIDVFLMPSAHSDIRAQCQARD